jgi:Xaa-Pro aminopeptidase
MSQATRTDPTDPAELRDKQRRLAELLERHGLDGALLTLRNNFAWVTCGRDNHIANNAPLGVATILATRDGRRYCLANSIEAPRMRGEELSGTGIETIDFPWWDRAETARIVRDVIGNRSVAHDGEDFGLGLRRLPDAFNELRWSLTPAEVERYREGARRASAAMEATCRAIEPGTNEHEAAGMLDDNVHSVGMNPVVTLIASDERIERFRHPIPVDKPIHRYVMLVTCAEFGGLISCLTRFVHFGTMTDELRAKQQAICNVDTAVNLATRPGRALGEVFADLQHAYAENGFADQWKLHHQGGSTGYAGREVVATPDSKVAVRADQPFAWNPSVTGVKSEDTILCTSSGIEVLTAASTEWPQLEGRSSLGTLMRPDMLVL